GAIGATPPGLGVVEGGKIPYQEWAAKKKQENYKNRLKLDPELKCHLPGVPRVTYLPYPFQIFSNVSQGKERLAIVYHYSYARRESPRVRSFDRGYEGLYAALEDPHAALSTSREKYAAPGVQMPGVHGRVAFGALSQAAEQVKEEGGRCHGNEAVSRRGWCCGSLGSGDRPGRGTSRLLLGIGLAQAC